MTGGGFGAAFASALKRLETIFDVELLIRSEKRAPLGLSESGRELSERYKNLWAPLGRVRGQRVFDVAVSQTLVTADVLGPAFLEFQRELGDSGARLRLRVGAEMDFHQAISDLQLGRIDLVVAWASDVRLGGRPPGVKAHRLASCDVVAVSHDEAIVESVNSHGARPRIRAAHAKRLVSLPPGAQVGEDRFPTVDAPGGGERIEVGAFDQAIALVRSRVADLAVVPGIYHELERHRHLGLVQYSDPIDTVELCAFTRLGTLDARLERLLDMIRASSRGDRRLTSSEEPVGMRDPLPSTPEFYESLRYGYYVGADAPASPGPLQWCDEQVELRWDADRQQFVGTIENRFEDVFRVEAKLYGPLFCLSATDTTEEDRTFVSVFSSCSAEPRVLCGTWSGRDRHDRPGVFGAVMADRRLGIAELRAYSHAASLQATLHVEHCVWSEV